MIVHLLEYQVATGHDAEVDSFVRHSALRAPPSPGILARCVGRRLGPVGHEHVAATEWGDLDSYRLGTAHDGIPEYLASVSALLRHVRSTRYRVVFSEGPGLESARILRIYRATVATEMLAAWGRRAAEPIDRLLVIPGMEKVITGVGVLAVDRPGETSIVAITAWRDWEAILQATGGHIDRLLLETELADIERPLDVAHYQLPGLKDQPVA